MPSTVGGLIIFLLAVIPGVPGETAYSSLVGLDWREDRLWRLVRVLLFSAFGLVLYIAATTLTPLPPPFYVVPERAASVTIRELPSGALSYAGHALCAFLVGAGTAYAARQLARWTGSTTYPAVWDDFITNFVPGHWVVVKLENGNTFAGMLEAADLEAPKEDRDILLTEPALYVEDRQAFETLAYQHLYLPAAQISSVAVYYDPDRDERVTEVNQTLFQEDERQTSEHGRTEGKQPSDPGAIKPE